MKYAKIIKTNFKGEKMGSWGTALHSNDTSSDVRDMCNEVYSLVSVEKGTKLIFDEFADIVRSDMIDDDYANFWFALADWQWKHGILNNEIKNIAISLLETHAGIDEWQESGSAADVKKRLAVMEKLLIQLKSPQPEVKIPKAKIARPKHKPGDIIIVRTGSKENDPENRIWNIENCQYSFIYAQELAGKICETLNPPYDAHNKYIAILCIGTEKTPHSQYVDGIFDEYSVYTFYDYISDEKPTLDILKICGFVPKYLQYADDDGPNIKTSGWCYKFRLLFESFRLPKDGREQYIEKLFCSDESNRFCRLFNAKQYLLDISWYMELFDAFAEFFEEKARLIKAGIPYDNLLDNNISNPTLRSKSEISKIIANRIKEEMLRIESNN